MTRTNDGPKLCRGCGAEILIIKSGGYYGRVTVDAEPLWIRQETGGESFFTMDGRTVFGVQAGDADDDPDANFLEVYRPHKGHCPTGGRAPRNRQRRPSGYR